MKKKKFVFFHGYRPELWDGYVKRGLIRENAGIRFCESIDLPEEMKFNNLAGKDSKLYRLIKDNKYPLYIDRLQGGCYIEKYPYDAELINDYRAMLGDDFYGFQMHEWMSNLRSDFEKLKDLGREEWTEENITREILKKFPFPHVFLEAASADEFANRLPDPDTNEQFIEMAQRLFRNRLDAVAGDLLPCDSALLAFDFEYSSGVRYVMPEIGAQTPATNIQMAYARGTAKAYHKSFGAYYEPWGGSPFSTCAYHDNGENEWNIRSGADFPFETCGCNGGSSRSLQKRMYLYAYLGGASFISEEWGAFNTFYDSDDYTLSPYGEAKLDFLNFADRYEPGEFYAPIAIVLPADLPVIDCIYTEKEEWIAKRRFESEDFMRKCGIVHDGLQKLMFDRCSHFGHETNSLFNSFVPDAFDIIHENHTDMMDRYRYLVDLTGSDYLKSSRPNVIDPDEAKERIISLMPCEVKGGLHWFVNRLEDGWYLTVMNHDGIDRCAEHGEQLMPEAVKTAVIEIKDGLTLNRLEGSGNITVADGKYHVVLQAGEIFFAKLQDA